MLGRKTYTQEELDHAKTAVAQQLTAYRKLVKAIDGATSDPKVTSALEAFEPHGNPLNEVELMSDSFSRKAIAEQSARAPLLLVQSSTSQPIFARPPARPP